MKTELFPYQKEGVRFLVNGKKYKYLADDMGLGKTAQLIIAADRIKAKRIVVICPAGIKYHWARQFHQWSNTKRSVFVVENTKSLIPHWAEIIVVNYELLLNDKEDSIYAQLKRRASRNSKYDLVIADEAHYIKNKDAQRSRRIFGRNSFLVEARRIWLASGTPYLNYPVEIFYPASKLAKELIAPYNDYEAFCNQYCAGRMNFTGQYVGASNIEELRERLRPFILRRTKEEVLHQLPDKVHTVVDVDVEVYCSVEDTPMSTVRREVGLAKIPHAVKHISDVIQSRQKLVVFCHHRDVIFGISEKLQCEHEIIIGGLSAEEKQKRVDSFIENPDVQVIILQTHTGGQGVDGLQKVCSYVLMVEPDWSPGVMDQAIDRLYRIGQKSTLFVNYLVARGTLDDIIKEKETGKREVIVKLLQDDRRTPKMTPNQKAEALTLIAGAMQSIAASLAIIAGDTQHASVPNETPAQSAPKSSAPASADGVQAGSEASLAPKRGRSPKSTPTTISKEEEEKLRAAISQFLGEGLDAKTMEKADIERLRKERTDIVGKKILKEMFGVEKLVSLTTDKVDGLLEVLADGPGPFEDELYADNVDSF